MTAFGWCVSRQHELCRVEFTPWHFGVQRAGRKVSQTIVFDDIPVKCSCICHVPEEERPKARKRVAKKATPKPRRKK